MQDRRRGLSNIKAFTRYTENQGAAVFETEAQGVVIVIAAAFRAAFHIVERFGRTP